jgi:hypothetical protein
MTNDLKTELTLLAHEEAPFSTIDISKAQREGRRRMLTGRLAAAGTGVVVIAACGLAIGGLAGGGDAATTRPAAPGGTTPAGTAPAAKVPVAFTGTDPLSAHASFGRLPAGWRTGSVEDGPDYGNHIEAYGGADKQTGPRADLEISGEERTTESFGPSATSAPATVPGGQKAEYITLPVSGLAFSTPEYGLQWQTPKGTWATLFVTHTGAKDASLALLDSLAAGVTLGETQVPLPLHVDGLPKDFPARSQELNVPGFEGKAFEVELVFGGGDRQVIVTAEPSEPKAVPQTDPSRAAISPPPTGTVKPDRACKDDKGLTVCATTKPGVLASVGGAQGLLDHITSLGADNAKWTTHVVG